VTVIRPGKVRIDQPAAAAANDDDDLFAVHGSELYSPAEGVYWQLGPSAISNIQYTPQWC
jgi:hypothetical protein